jgi:uncharacterized protein
MKNISALLISKPKTEAMALFDQITEDIKKAMLAREKEKLESLRAIKSALLLARTEKGAGDSISEETEIRILQKLLNQRKEAADIYKEQNREDLWKVEVAEAGFIEAYLPKMLSEDEVVAQVKMIIAETGAKGPADMGKVMGVATKKFAGKADNRLVSSKVKELLAGM